MNVFLLRSLAKEGMEKSRDRLQCTKSYTLYLGVLSLSNPTNQFLVYGILFQGNFRYSVFGILLGPVLVV